MKKKLAVLIFILLSLILLYLNRSYSRIYDRNLVPDLSVFWVKPVLFKNPNFQNVVKYVAIGDSLSVGIGSTDAKKSLPYIIATKLAANMTVSLVNLAVLGATADDVTETQLSRVKQEQPNYITVFIGTNDIHSLITPSSYESKMDYILNYLTSNTQAKILVFNMPFLGSENLILFPYNVFFDYQTRQYNLALSNVSKKYNVTLIDFYTPTKNNFAKQSSFYSVDHFHPSADGYMMWVGLINSNDL